MAMPVSLARQAAVWLLSFRKRDVFRMFLVYVFLRHVPRGVEAPPHYLTGRALAPQSVWLLKVFNYFVADPVRSVVILIEACVRRDFDAGRRQLTVQEGNQLEAELDDLEDLLREDNTS